MTFPGFQKLVWNGNWFCKSRITFNLEILCFDVQTDHFEYTASKLASQTWKWYPRVLETDGA